MTENSEAPTLAQRSTINPYRSAANSFLDRLRWDLKPVAWQSRHSLRSWKNRCIGGKAVILCNGPSLLKTDFSLLDGVFTFGLNKINLLFDKESFRPSCIVAVNHLVIEQNRDFFNKTDIPLFLEAGGLRWVHKRKHAVFLHSAEQSKFARDCSISIQLGYTVTFVAMQLAFHMGFRNIALVGCDHNFATKGPANQTVVSGATDESHFDPRYFSNGAHWQLPDLAASEYYYELAREVYVASGGSITNSTVGGKLEVFGRQELAQWIKAPL